MARTPIYERIKQELRKQIQNGSLSEGARVPSETELAAERGVSRNQTRQALRDLEMEGYLLRYRGKGSFVAPARQRQSPRPAVRKGLRTIMIAYPRAAHAAETYYGRCLARGFTEGTKAHGVQPMFYYLDFDREAELSFLRNVPDLGVEGLALWPQFDTAPERDLVAHIARSGFPLVMWDTRFLEFETDFVGTANRNAFDRLTTALLERGHRRIAFVPRDLNLSVMRDRFAGYRWALDRAGVRYDANLVPGSKQNPVLNAVPPNPTPMRESVEEKTRCLLALNRPPTALVCSDTMTAEVVESVLRNWPNEAPAPTEIATMHDDLEPSRADAVPWIVAIQDGVAIGRSAAELLLERIADPGRPVEMRFINALFPDGREGR